MTWAYPPRKALKGKLVTRRQYRNWATPVSMRNSCNVSSSLRFVGADRQRGRAGRTYSWSGTTATARRAWCRARPGAAEPGAAQARAQTRARPSFEPCQCQERSGDFSSSFRSCLRPLPRSARRAMRPALPVARSHAEPPLLRSRYARTRSTVPADTPQTRPPARPRARERVRRVPPHASSRAKNAWQSTRRASHASHGPEERSSGPGACCTAGAGTGALHPP